MRILFVCTQSPAPSHGGGALRSADWMHTIADFADIGMVVLTRSKEQEQQVRSLAADNGWWLRTVHAPRTVAARILDLLRSRLGATPYALVAGCDRRLHRAVEKGLREFVPQVVQAELLPAAQYLAGPQASGVATVYSAHNVESRIVAGFRGSRCSWRQRAAHGRTGQLAAGRLRRYERKYARQADAVVAVSTLEAEWFRGIARQVVWVPNALRLDAYHFRLRGKASASSLLFTGHLDYPPNRDAAGLLVEQILPRVACELPAARCRIAGASPAAEVLKLAGGRVEVIADFVDFEEISAGSGVFVSPLRWGAGSRLKLLEAAAVGLPIVATPFSAEGLALEPGRDFVAATSATDIAAAVVALSADPARRDALATSARRTVERYHDWPSQRETIRSLYAGLSGDSNPR